MRRRTDADHESARFVTRTALGAILLAAAALRLSHLGRDSAWVDEVLSISFSNGSLIEIARKLKAQQLPLYFWVNSFFQAYSVAEGWLRLPSALYGIALVPVVFLIGAEIGRSRTGLTAAALAAVSHYLISHSQEIRQYALMVLLSLVGTWAVTRFRRDPGRITWTVLGIASLLNLYTSPFAAFIVAIHWAAVAALAWRERRRQLLGYALLVAVLYVPAVAHMWPMLSGSASIVHYSDDDYRHFLPLVTTSLVNFAGWIPTLAVLLAAGSVAGAAVLWRRCRVFVLIALASFVVPVASLYIKTPGHFFDPRYLIYALPHLLLLTATAIVRLWDRATKRFAWPTLDTIGPAAVGVAVVYTVTLMTPHYELLGRTPDWRGAARAILAGLHDGDCIAVKPFFDTNTVLYQLDQLAGAGRRVQVTPESENSWYRQYHRNRRVAEHPEDFRGPTITMTAITDLAQLDDLPSVAGTIWLITDELPASHRDEFAPVMTLGPVDAAGMSVSDIPSPILYRRVRHSADRAARSH
ncbi:MAG TPA: glycosyltransferase family 39 protein [Candidatus Binatia bacterium]|nr:glycosyltransferase family 39 protein [Candidatus Binatia bacterium]